METGRQKNKQLAFGVTRSVQSVWGGHKSDTPSLHSMGVGSKSGLRL